MSATLHAPCFISSRLMVAVKIAYATISLQYASTPGNDGRTRYGYWIDIDTEDDETPRDVNQALEFYAEDIQSGCQGGDLAQGFGSLFSFLGAWVEAFEYSERSNRADSEGCDMFPRGGILEEWARANSDEITMMGAAFEPQEWCDCGHVGECEACQQPALIVEE